MKKIMFFIYGEHCTYGDDEDYIEGDRFYIDKKEITYDEDGEIEDEEVLEGFADEVFISDDKEMLWEAEYEDDKVTEFTNGLWNLGEYESLDDAIKFLKEKHIPSVLNEK